MYDFLKEPTREKFRILGEQNLGEEDGLDFKEKWCDEYAKFAKIILGLANFGGGAIIIGVKQKKDGSFESVGLEELVDKSIVGSKLKKYLPTSLVYYVYDLCFEDISYEKLKDKKFQVIKVESDLKKLPYISTSESDKNIEKDAIYLRKNTSTEKVNYDDLQKLIDKRIGTYHRSEKLSLNKNLEDLKVLYGELKTTVVTNNFTKMFSSLTTMFVETAEEKKSEFYPVEDYEQFIASCIDKKKNRIKIDLDIDL